MDGQMNGVMNGWMNGWTDEQRWNNGLMKKQINEWMGG